MPCGITQFLEAELLFNLLVKRTCASYAGWSAYRER